MTLFTVEKFSHKIHNNARILMKSKIGLMHWIFDTFKKYIGKYKINRFAKNICPMRNLHISGYVLLNILAFYLLSVKSYSLAFPVHH